MANLVITTSTNNFLVDFGIYSGLLGYKKGSFQKANLVFQLMQDESFVRVENIQGENWAISFNSMDEALVVDSIDGIAPTSNSDLFDKLYSKL